MPYQIDKTDGTVLITLADGVVDNTTDLQLVGRNVAGYGEIQNENFVKLLENFASVTTPPSKPQVGQIWFDKEVNAMRPSVFDGVLSAAGAHLEFPLSHFSTCPSVGVAVCTFDNALNCAAAILASALALV